MLPLRAVSAIAAACLATAALAGEATLTGQAHVVDGDTLRIGGIGVRMKGIAAPERREPGYQEAADALRDLIGGRPVTCELTGETTKAGPSATARQPAALMGLGVAFGQGYLFGAPGQLGN